MKCVIPQQERIHGDNFIEMSDFRYERGYSLPDGEGETYSIFCKADILESLFQEIRNNPQTYYVILSHESDRGIANSSADQIPTNVKKLFGQNIECDSSYSQVESIPIGSVSTTWIGEKEFAYNTEYIDWLPSIHQYEKIEVSAEEKNFINLVYMNFAIHTNSSHRRPIYDHFKDLDWVNTKECTLSGSDYINSSDKTTTKDYYEELYNHKFTISPLGNGVDCGRVWSAICVGTIPIIPDHRNLDFYRELPILAYKDINEITESYLNDKWEEMSNKEYDLSKATVSYWKRRIEDEKCK